MKKPVQKKAMGGLMGIIPMAIEHMQSKKRKDRRSGEGPSGPSDVTGMKKGGKVGRGDGACMKGRTKGKMV
jgi:hypothetical protein